MLSLQLRNFSLAMERPSSQGSIPTDTSEPDSLFSKFSEASEVKIGITRPPRTRPGAVPDILFSPVLDHVCELKHLPVPLLHLGDVSVQPTSKPPRIQSLDPPYPARRPSFDHGPPATTQVRTRTRYLPSPVGAAEQCSQVKSLFDESSPGLMLVGGRVARVFTLFLTNPAMIFSPHCCTLR